LFELPAACKFAEYFFSQRLLCFRVPGVLLSRNHDHSQLDLFLGRKQVAMLPVEIFNLCRRDNVVGLDVVAAHRLNDYSLHLLFLELSQRIILRLKSFDKGIAVAAKVLPNDIVHALVHNVIRDLKAFLLERLDDKSSIYQVLQSKLAYLFQFVFEILTGDL
jgi:hypothetical protein